MHTSPAAHTRVYASVLGASLNIHIFINQWMMEPQELEAAHLPVLPSGGKLNQRGGTSPVRYQPGSERKASGQHLCWCLN